MHAGIVPPKLREQPQAVPMRHVEVGDQGTETPLAASLEGHLSVARNLHGVEMRRKHARQRSEHGWLVVDQKN